MRLFLIILFILLANNSYSASVIISNSVVEGQVPVKSWKYFRDKNIVKQDLDYSCGAASIATILTEYYQRPTTEKEVLLLLVEEAGQDWEASFADMQKILPSLGFRGIGIAVSWEQLTQLKMPVLLYVKQREQGHFTVISGIDNDSVTLADPSLGNRFLTRGQFKEIWHTREQTGLEGKMLAILPLGKKTDLPTNPHFFSKPYFSSIPTKIIMDDLWLR